MRNEPWKLSVADSTHLSSADLCEEFFCQAVGGAEDESCGGSENGGVGTALLFGLNLTSLLDCLQIFGPATLGQTALVGDLQCVSMCRYSVSLLPIPYSVKNNSTLYISV